MRAYNLQNEQPPAFPDKFQIVRNAVLSRTSLEANNNKFYVLEVHEADGQYRLFTNYGRVGADGVKEGRFSTAARRRWRSSSASTRKRPARARAMCRLRWRKATVGSSALRTETEQTFQAKRARQIIFGTATSSTSSNNL